MSFQEVPYVVLSGVAKTQVLEILGTGNTLLKKWATYFPNKKYRVFRNQVMNLKTVSEDCIMQELPATKLVEFKKDLPLILTIKHDQREFLGCRTVEEAILEGFAALAKQHATKWSLENNPLGLTFHDFLQEAYMQIVEAMYSWMPEHKVELSTYIWYALKNRMSNVANQQGNTFCPLSNPDLELLIKYKKIKNQMNHNATFDQVAYELGLNNEQSLHLSKLVVHVMCENQMINTKFKNKEVNDYTEQAVGRHQETETIIQTETVKNTLDRANLTTLERKIIELAMDPYPGWQTDLANNTINPSTKKPYSRMRINQVFQIAKDKVANVLKLDAA